jgi:hypothetical protein
LQLTATQPRHIATIRPQLQLAAPTRDPIGLETTRDPIGLETMTTRDPIGLKIICKIVDRTLDKQPIEAYHTSTREPIGSKIVS